MIVEYHSIKTQIELINENVEVKAFDIDTNNLETKELKLTHQ